MIGKGLMIDHAHSIVIGETAVIGDNVSMLHSVTLGGTGKNEKDRHPKVGDGVLIGAGAKVLGNIAIGNCSRIAAGSVVLKDSSGGATLATINTPAGATLTQNIDFGSEGLNFKVNDCDIWGLQYHPEITYNKMINIIVFRKEKLLKKEAFSDEKEINNHIQHIEIENKKLEKILRRED